MRPPRIATLAAALTVTALGSACPPPAVDCAKSCADPSCAADAHCTNAPPVNHAPEAGDVTLSTDEDVPLTIVLAATDPDGDALTFTVGTEPAHGALTGTAPNLVYTPAANFNGSDSFTMTANDGHLDSAVAIVTITVAAVDDAPVATSGSISTSEDTPGSITLAGTDLENDALTFNVVTQPAHGTLSGTEPDLVYTPDADYNGADSFTFVANDGTDDSAAATVDVTVTAVNDAPVAIVAALATDEDTPLSFTLGGADVDGDALTFTVATQPVHGVLSGAAPDLVYTPDADFHGFDSFTFTANDGTVDSDVATVSITVNAVDDAPVATAAALTTLEDTPLSVTLAAVDIEGDVLAFRVVDDPVHGTLSGTAPDLVYTPDPDYNGADSFTFTANDGTATSAGATISITVNAVNDAPVAANASLTTAEDTPLSIVLAATDVDGDALTFTFGTPIHGNLGGIAPNLTYTAPPNFHGADSFTFTANDGTVDSLVGTISIAVTSVNDAPVATSASLTTNEDTPLSIGLTGTDIDGDGLTFAVATQPLHGTLSGTAPSFIYTPDANFNGVDSFTFTANDRTVDSAPGTISITVNPENDAPTVASQSVSTDEDTPLPIVVVADDVDGDALGFVLSTPAHGTVSGTVPDLVYTPEANFSGADSFTITANDGVDSSNVAVISIDVAPVADAPFVSCRGAGADVGDSAPIALDYRASLVDDDGSEVLTSVTLSGVPTGATLASPALGTLTLDRFAVQTFGVEPGPRAAAVGRFDPDGFDDVVVANEIAGSVTIAHSTGDGSFTNVTNVSLGFQNAAHDVVVGDFDDNGVDDIAVSTNRGVSLLLGNVGGVFAPPFDVPVSARSVSDRFNVDGVPNPARWDVVSPTLPGPGSVQVVGGHAVFNDRGYLNTVDDFDPIADDGVRITGTWTFFGDDFLQILTRSDGTPGGGFGETNNGIEFFVQAIPPVMTIGSRGALNVSGATVTTPAIIEGVPYAFEIVDDGVNLRFTIANAQAGTFVTTATTSSPAQSPSLVAFHNRESGHTAFLDDVAIATQLHAAPRGLAVGRFNGDAVDDLAVTLGGDDAVSIILGAASGDFAPAATFPAGSGPVQPAVGDFNGDSLADLAVVNGGSNDVSVLLGNGDGTFNATALNAPVGASPTSLAVGRFDGDDVDDLVVTESGANAVGILLGDGNGGFAPEDELTAPPGSQPRGVVVGRFNGDAFDDLFVTNDGSEDVSVFFGNGDGTFGASESLGAGSGIPAKGHFTGSGLDDVVTVSFTGSVADVYFNQGDVQTIPLTDDELSGLTITPPVGVDGAFDLSLAATSEELATEEQTQASAKCTVNISPGVTSGLTLWLRADSIDADDRAPIAVWHDNSGNNRDALQGLTASQPTLHDDAVRGQPAVAFDGVDDTLTHTGFPLFADNDSGLTVFTVFRPTSTDQQRFLLTFPQINCSNQFELGYHTGSGSHANFGVHAGCGTAAVTTSSIDTSFQLLTTRVLPTGTKPDNVQVFDDGTEQSMESDNGGWTTPGNYPSSPADLAIGSRASQSNGFHDGDIAEIIIFDRDLSDAERGTVEGYLRNKYGFATPPEFIAGLDGFADDSTFSLATQTPLPVLGWVAVVGSSAQVFAAAGVPNGTLIGGTAFGNYTVEYDTSTALLPSATYTLHVDMGFDAGIAGGDDGFLLELGTENGGVFTQLASKAGNVSFAGNLDQGNVSGTADLVFTAGATTTSDPLVVRWSQTSTKGPGFSDFFGIDNVTLAVAH